MGINFHNGARTYWIDICYLKYPQKEENLKFNIMIKVLKLQKAVYAIILGVLALIAAQIMSSQKVEGSNIMLTISGILLIIGALLFLYPILFAKKVDSEGESVELKPVAKVTGEDDSNL